MAYRGITERCVIMFSKIYMHNHSIRFVKTYLKVHQKAPQRTYISNFPGGGCPRTPLPYTTRAYGARHTGPDQCLTPSYGPVVTHSVGHVYVTLLYARKTKVWGSESLYYLFTLSGENTTASTTTTAAAAAATAAAATAEAATATAAAAAATTTTTTTTAAAAATETATSGKSHDYLRII